MMTPSYLSSLPGRMSSAAFAAQCCNLLCKSLLVSAELKRELQPVATMLHCQQAAVRAPRRPGRCHEVANLLRPCSSTDLPSACVHRWCGTNDVSLLLHLATAPNSRASACSFTTSWHVDAVGKERKPATNQKQVTICSRYVVGSICKVNKGEGRQSVPATCTKFLCLQAHYWATDHVDLWEQL